MRLSTSLLSLLTALLLAMSGQFLGRVAHASLPQQPWTPSPTPLPTITLTPTPLPVATYTDMRSHAVKLGKKNDGYYGARARMWIGSPLLRWPMFSYSAIWVAGNSSVAPATLTPAAPATTATPNAPPTCGPGTPCPRSGAVVPLALMNGSIGEHDGQHGPLSATTTATSTPWPTAAPADQFHAWIEAGFARVGAPILECPSPCDMDAIWAITPGVGHWASKANAAGIYQLEIYRSDKLPPEEYISLPPANPNPTLPYWAIRIWEYGYADDRTLIFEKQDIPVGIVVADDIHMGGEVFNQWPSHYPRPSYFNDMGRTAYSRTEYLKYEPRTDKSGWRKWVKYQTVKSDTPKRPPGAPSTQYNVATYRQLQFMGMRPFTAYGYNGTPMQGTWRVCDCGVVYCNPSGPPSPVGHPLWPWP